MEIRNVTEFRNFVTSNGLGSSHPDIQAVVICVMDYERGCNCWKAKDRQKIYNNCRLLYARAVLIVTSSLQAHFLKHASNGKLSFYQNGVLLASIHR